MVWFQAPAPPFRRRDSKAHDEVFKPRRSVKIQQKRSGLINGEAVLGVAGNLYKRPWTSLKSLAGGLVRSVDFQDIHALLRFVPVRLRSSDSSAAHLF